MFSIKRLAAAAISVLTVASLAACGSANAASESESGTDKNGTITVNVGTMGTYSPYSIKNTDGSYTGYDLEVLKAVEKVEPSLKFEFHAGSWDSLFTSLDANKNQMIANEIGKTKEREQKYIFTKNSYNYSTRHIIVKKGTKGINTLDDLKGKVVGGTVGDNHTKFLEEWNNAHGNPITIKYYEEDFTTVVRDVASGRIAATINDPNAALDKAKKQNIPVEAVGEPLSAQPVYYIFRNDDQGKKIRDKIDEGLDKLKKNGELSKLSIEWFGQDTTEETAK